MIFASAIHIFFYFIIFVRQNNDLVNHKTIKLSKMTIKDSIEFKA